MDILRDQTACPERLQGASLAIGNFDGVHRGHQAVLDRAVAAAREAGTRAGAIVFEPHPRQFFQPDRPLFRLTPLPLKLKLFETLGLDMTVVLTFDSDLAGLTAQAFTRSVLVERLAASHVVTGYDFHFGKGRDGNPDRLKHFGAAMGFQVTVVEAVGAAGEAPFSSSAVRAALRAGEPETAAHMLGYWWRFSGDVIRGAGRGSGLGFPTANLVLPHGTELKHGIYAVRAYMGSARHDGAAYIGTRPTFDDGTPQAEVHLFDFDGDVYGHALEVEIVAYLRGDAAFDSTEALKAQMHADCGAARAILARVKGNEPMCAYPLGRALGGAS